jgi:hypothetical protein
MSNAAEPTNAELPIILVRGFGGLDVSDEKNLTYYGFNDGTDRRAAGRWPRRTLAVWPTPRIPALRVTTVLVRHL